MKVSNIVNGVTALQKLSQQDVSIKVGYNLSKILEDAQKILTIFDGKRKALMENIEEPTPEQQAELSAELTKFLDEDIDMPVTKISIEDLSDVKLSSADITSILWLLDMGD